MKIYKTFIRFESDDEALHRVDTIWHEQRRWLVPSWTEHPTGEWRSPARIIYPEKGLYLPMSVEADFLLSESHIPKSVFDGHTKPPPENPFIVIEAPDIRWYYDDVQRT